MLVFSKAYIYITDMGNVLKRLFATVIYAKSFMGPSNKALGRTRWVFVLDVTRRG